MVDFRKLIQSALVFSVLLGGCIYRAPEEFLNDLNTYREGKSSLYVYRPPTSWYSLIGQTATVIIIDGTPVCTITQGQWTRFHLDPGQHSIKVTTFVEKAPRIQSQEERIISNKIKLNMIDAEYYVRIMPVGGVDLYSGTGPYSFAVVPLPSMLFEIKLIDSEDGKKGLSGKYIKPGEESWLFYQINYPSLRTKDVD